MPEAAAEAADAAEAVCAVGEHAWSEGTVVAFLRRTPAGIVSGARAIARHTGKSMVSPRRRAGR